MTSSARTDELLSPRTPAAVRLYRPHVAARRNEWPCPMPAKSMMSWLPLVMPAPIKPVVVAQLHGDDAAGARPSERRERRLLDGAALGHEEHVLVVLERLDGHDRVDALTFFERQQVDDGTTARTRPRLRNLR